MTLELEAVGHDHRDGAEAVHALVDVTLTVARGELVALLGPSGAGKSTLLLLATGTERPTRGTVRWDGRDLGQVSRREREAFRREVLGMLVQTPHMQPGVDAVGNVESRLLGSGMRPSQARAKARALLVDLGLEERLRHTPNKLSGGERRRVGLARALANDPQLLLADEPTAMLDSIHGQVVLDRLQLEAHTNNRAVLMVTHDPHAAAIADRRVTLHDGHLLPDAAPLRSSKPLAR